LPDTLQIRIDMLSKGMYISEDLPIDKNYPESCLYWIKLPEHTDPRTQGYVGVSVRGCHKRMLEHYRATAKGSDLIVHRAMRKHTDNIEVVDLLKASPEFCLMVERELRPIYRTEGTWNINAGGELAQLGCKQTPERIERRVAKLRGKVRSDEQREAMSKAFKGIKRSVDTRLKMSISRIGRIVSDPTKAKIRASHLVKNSKIPAWGHPASKDETWVSAIKAFEYMGSFPTHKAAKIARHLGLKRNSITAMYNKLCAGWNPSEDSEYINWLEEKLC
jgi:hypothetical protein